MAGEYPATDIGVALWIEIYVFFVCILAPKSSTQCELSHIAPVLFFLTSWFNVQAIFSHSLIPVNDDN